VCCPVGVCALMCERHAIASGDGSGGGDRRECGCVTSTSPLGRECRPSFPACVRAVFSPHISRWMENATHGPGYTLPCKMAVGDRP
jgi:hypothetical protein